EAKLRVLLPEDIRGERAQAAEARLALAHRFLGLRAPHELADLPAHELHRLQQPLVGRAHAPALEDEDADHLVLRDYRNGERRARARLAGEPGARGTRIFFDVGHPYRLARLPGGAKEPYARLVRHGSRELEVALHRRVV